MQKDEGKAGHKEFVIGGNTNGKNFKVWNEIGSEIKQIKKMLKDG